MADRPLFGYAPTRTAQGRSSRLPSQRHCDAADTPTRPGDPITAPSNDTVRSPRWQGAFHPDAAQVALVALLVLAILTGALASISIIAGILLVAVLAAIGILALGRRVIPVFHGGLIVILVGYAFVGKGFAYLGVPPLYVGEMVLALCIASIVWSIGRARLGVLHLLLILFMAWGAIRTIPYIATDGIDALRDGATWVYGFFAIGVSLTVRPEHLGRIASGYRRLIPLFLAWVPVAAVITFVAGDALPTTPGTDVPFLVFKAGDSAVQLAGVAAFILLGLYNEFGAASGARELVLWAMWLVGAGLTAALNRAAIHRSLRSVGSGRVRPRLEPLDLARCSRGAVRDPCGVHRSDGRDRRAAGDLSRSSRGEPHERLQQPTRYRNPGDQGLAGQVVEHDRRLHGERALLLDWQRLRDQPRRRRWLPGTLGRLAPGAT